MTTKHVRDMDENEKAETLARLKKGPVLPPLPTDRKAADMSQAEREEWIREHSRRCG